MCYRLPDGELVRAGDSGLLDISDADTMSECLSCGMVAWGPAGITPLLEYTTPSDRDKRILRVFPPSEDEAIP